MERAQSPNVGKRIQVQGGRLHMKKPLTAAEKYRQLKAQTERAGMKVDEVDGKIVVRRKAPSKTKK